MAGYTHGERKGECHLPGREYGIVEQPARQAGGQQRYADGYAQEQSAEESLPALAGGEAREQLAPAYGAAHKEGPGVVDPDEDEHEQHQAGALQAEELGAHQAQADVYLSEDGEGQAPDRFRVSLPTGSCRTS